MSSASLLRMIDYHDEFSVWLGLNVTETVRVGLLPSVCLTTIPQT